jgi:hypothetical protein
MNHSPDITALPKETPLISIVSALGGEFSELGRFIEQLQSVLSPALLRLADDPGCHRNVQMLDLLAQRLNVLSIFLSSLSLAVPASLMIDAQSALDAVNLSELAWRLQGIETSYTDQEPGSLEMF